MNGRSSSPARAAVAVNGKPQHEGSEDPIREALFCLAAADKRLKKGNAQQADEILSLLRAATTHLEDALRAGNTPSRIQLTGAE